MNYPIFFNSKNSLKLFGLQGDLKFIQDLYLKKKLPKVLMYTGIKGLGKSTIINHFLFSLFDRENYDKKNSTLSKDSVFLKQFQENLFSNIIYIKGEEFNSVKVEDIRNLKTKILQSTISNRDRFIIFDDIELFNQHSLNALLKIIEEPSEKNFFILINNKSRPLLQTIKSRSLEIKIILNEKKRFQTINELVNFYKLTLVLDPQISKLSPGNFLKFNHLCHEFNISPNSNFVENLSLILNLYKKNKDVLFVNLIFFITDYYFKFLKEKSLFKDDKIFETKNFVFDNLNNYMLYNLNQNSLINAVNEKLKNE
tara:strand:+ start:674 stop:1609 length:936 start_codon:yes stop_codon:yes gene_type:complete